jgi:hypothetical protein
MKCTRCLALNADGDATCYHCGVQLSQPTAPTESKRMPVPQRFAAILMCIGFVVGDNTLPKDFPTKSTSGINFGRALCIGGFTGVFGSIGLAVGTLFDGRRRRA